MTDLSIIVVNYNTKYLLQEYLRSIGETVTDLTIEILVVDNASSDGSVEMVRTEFPQVQLICNSENLGFARSANLALTRGRGRYFLISHPDIKLLPGAVQEMHTFLKTHPRVGIIGANLLFPDGSYGPCAYKRHSMRQDLIDFIYPSLRGSLKMFPWLKRKFEQERNYYYWDHQTTAESARIWNACMMFRQEVLKTAGNFYEGFYVWFADTDWCYRAKSVGWQMYYLAEAKVIHYERQSTNYIDRTLVGYKLDIALIRNKLNKDRYTFLKRHHTPAFLWLAKSLNTVLQLKLALRRFVTLFHPGQCL